MTSNWAQIAAFFDFFDHGQCHAVLFRTRGIVSLEFEKYPSAAGGHDVLQLDERRIADGLKCVVEGGFDERCTHGFKRFARKYALSNCRCRQN